MNRAQAATVNAIVRFLTARASSAAKCGRPRFVAQYTRWADVVSDLAKSQPRGCVGCYYEGEEVNRCMTCDQMTWRVNKYTKTEVKE